MEVPQWEAKFGVDKIYVRVLILILMEVPQWVGAGCYRDIAKFLGGLNPYSNGSTTMGQSFSG